MSAGLKSKVYHQALDHNWFQSRYNNSTVSLLKCVYILEFYDIQQSLVTTTTALPVASGSDDNSDVIVFVSLAIAVVALIVAIIAIVLIVVYSKRRKSKEGTHDDVTTHNKRMAS